MNTDFSLLDYVDPSQLDYQDWLSVGMAIKHEGGTAYLWDQWSQRDTKRFKDGECYRKWDGFNGSGNPVTWGTVVEFAKQQGWRPRESRAFEWDDEIKDDLCVIDTGWVEDKEVAEPTDNWKPVDQLIEYIETLFSAEEHVGYVTEYWDNEDRKSPKKGVWSRTAGELIQELRHCKGDICAVVGDYDPEVGAWIRFNPLDGQGIRDANVTSFRYTLVESDTLDVERQAAIYAELELPIAALVHSGKKSLHAIVRVDAKDKEEYRDRVHFLHEVCKKNGLPIDTQNKNASRLSRMPGIMRAGRKQHLVAVNQGKASWAEWREWIDAQNDDLPDIECLADLYESPPPLAPPLIDGILRQGHKMLLSGPSKAGKSYILLELAMAIAEGREWLGWKCSKGKVLYVNLELDRASCLHRLRGLYQSYEWPPANIGNIEIWNLRGKAVPMDRLAPKLIRRAVKRGYACVIIDPIYKVITGDENAADKMAHFCNQFDRVCAELGSAVVYCHHHSKGAQGQKSARDRASGSGVFARDPDAIIDLIELIISTDRRKAIENQILCPAIAAYLDEHSPGWDIPQDVTVVADQFVKAASDLLAQDETFLAMVRDVRRQVQNVSGWRMEGTLREFPPIPATRMLFRYPLHVIDHMDLLKDAKAEGEEAPWAGGKEKRVKQKEKKLSNKEKLMNAFLFEAENGACKIGDMADHLGIDNRTARAWLAEQTALVACPDGSIMTKEDAQNREVEALISLNRDLSGSVKFNQIVMAMECSERHARRRVEATGRYQIKGGMIVEVES